MSPPSTPTTFENRVKRALKTPYTLLSLILWPQPFSLVGYYFEVSIAIREDWYGPCPVFIAVFITSMKVTLP